LRVKNLTRLLKNTFSSSWRQSFDW